MNRRRFLSLSMGMIGAAGVPAKARAYDPGAWSDEVGSGEVPSLASQSGASIARGYDYISFAMDAYQQGQALRLIQSYSDSAGLGTTAFVPDNAYAILALLERGQRNDVGRAGLIGDSFIYAQSHDPTYSDGRVRQAYYVAPFTLPYADSDSYFVRPDGSVNLVGAPFFFQGSSVSDLSWVGIALAHLYSRTGISRYLKGSVRIAEWILNNAFDTAGLGGYSAGVDAKNNRLSTKKLTEHNIDVYGFFTNLLAPLTRDVSWREHGQHALEFIQQMWNPVGGYFYIGSSDGSTIDPTPVLEEVQSESYLSLLDSQYADALDWAKTNLIASDTPQSLNSQFAGNLRLNGMSFSDVSRRATQKASPGDQLPDPDAVWFEGNAHMAAALFARRRKPRSDLSTFHGDIATARDYLDQIALAQAELGGLQTINGLGLPNASGVVAASNVLNTGTGFSYNPNVHLAATSWYLIAALKGNPYQL